VGPSGKTCQSRWELFAKKSTKWYAPSPKSPIPKGLGREVGWRRMPLALGNAILNPIKHIRTLDPRIILLSSVSSQELMVSVFGTPRMGWI